jgi:biotin transport system permease protein
VGVSGGPALAPASPASAAVDARVVLLVGLLLGVLVWRVGLAGNALYAATAAAVLAATGAGRSGAIRVARSAAPWALVWGGVKLGVDLLSGAPAAVAFGEVVLLTVRLAVLVLVGAALGALVTPRALGLALASVVRPLAPRSAWKVGLALLLMLHLVPRAWDALRSARGALRIRRIGLPWHREIVLVVEAGTRSLAVLTWDQALAVAARRLDRPEAWEDAPPPRLRDWCAGVAIAAAAIAAAAL